MKTTPIRIEETFEAVDAWSQDDIKRATKSHEDQSHLKDSAKSCGAEMSQAFGRFVQFHKAKGHRTKALKFASLLRKWIKGRLETELVIDPYMPELTFPAEFFKQQLVAAYKRAML